MGASYRAGLYTLPRTAAAYERSRVRVKTTTSLAGRVELGQVRGLEDVESGTGCGDAHARELWSPAQLLDICLAHVQEEQLRRIVLRAWGQFAAMVVFNAHVPERDGVARGSHAEHRLVRRVPVHARHGLLVPREARHHLVREAHVPALEAPVVAAREEQVPHDRVPGQHVHVA